MKSTTSSKVYASLQNGCLAFGGCPSINSGGRTLSDRGRVECFTASARKRFARYLRNARARYRVFITLTYPPGYGLDGRTCKRNLDAFVKRYARVAGGRAKNWSLVWWQEWQQNGRLHFHLLGTQPVHYGLIAKWWFEVVQSNSIDHLRAGTEIRKIRGNPRQLSSYAVKYAVKTEQKQVPEGFDMPGRFWGVVHFRGVVSASTTWGGWQNEDPDVWEALESLRRERDLLHKAGIIRRKEVEGDGYRVTLYLWDADNVCIREKLMFHVEQLSRVTK